MRQELLLALFNAQQKYDPVKYPGVLFEGYVKMCIMTEVKVACRRYTNFYYIKNPNLDSPKKFIIKPVAVHSFAFVEDIKGNI